MKAIKTKKQILEAVNGLTDSAIVRKYYACKTKQALHRLFEGKDNQITVENIKQHLLDETAVKTLKEEKHLDALKRVQRRQYCASIATILPAILGVWSPSFRCKSDNYTLGGNVKKLSAKWNYVDGGQYSRRCKYYKKLWYLDISIPASMRTHEFTADYRKNILRDCVTGQTWKMSGKGSSFTLNEIGGCLPLAN